MDKIKHWIKFDGMILVIFLLSTDVVWAQSCVQSLPLPSGANQNVDDSGLRPSKQPPIPFGGTLTYQCPGVKSYHGKSSWTVSCNNAGNYIFPSDLNVWPPCECNTDLTAKCSGVTYTLGYINQPGDNASLTLIFPQPLHLNAWTMTIITDIDIKAFKPSSTNSNLQITQTNGFTLSSSSNSSLNATFGNAIVWFDLSSIAIQGVVPHWKFPCIASIDCHYEVDNPTTNPLIWIVIVAVAGGFVLFIVVCSICYCCCASQQEQISTRPTSTTSTTWSVIEERNFQQQNRHPRQAFSSRF